MNQSTLDYNHAMRQTQHKLRGHHSASIKQEMKAFESLGEDIMPDVYGTGEVIEQFENKIASDLGKESAVFFPSGTMAQQIALRMWCDEKSVMKVGYHPLCHLEIHEQDGLKKLHHIETILLGERERLFHWMILNHCQKLRWCCLNFRKERLAAHCLAGMHWWKW